MKFITDYQIELAVIEDLTPEEIESVIAGYGSVDNYMEETKKLMEVILSDRCRDLNHNISVKVKSFITEK